MGNWAPRARATICRNFAGVLASRAFGHGSHASKIHPQILRKSLKEGRDFNRVPFDNLDIAAKASPDDLLDLEDTLEQLKRDYPRAHKMVELRFFAGLTEEETAEVLEIPLRTAQREWRFIRAWLHKQMS